MKNKTKYERNIKKHHKKSNKQERKTKKYHKKTKHHHKKTKHHHKKTKKQSIYPLFPQVARKSYQPSINEQLVSLKSNQRQVIRDCNLKEAFELKKPLKIGIPGFFYGKTCFQFDSPEAKQYLLSNLRANKHIDIRKVIPPKQLLSNCWFNTMFVTFFISDKGRYFFHFLRQLMIEGKQKNGITIPRELRNAFALFNFGIDSAIQGNKFAYEMDTNSIIHKIYNSIPHKYKKNNIVDINKAGNPLLYYIDMIKYLQNNALNIIYLNDTNRNWKDQLANAYKKTKKIPHIIIMEFFEENTIYDKKPVSFRMKEVQFEIDSAVLRDISKQHFCSVNTIDKKQIGYDGMSHHKLISLDWKDKMNSDLFWGFPGTLEETNGSPMRWNFMKSYQLLFYYRMD